MPKHQTRWNGFDDKILLLYARGMTVREIQAHLQLLYLTLRNISKKWTMPIRDWKAAPNRFTIQFEERLPQL